MQLFFGNKISESLISLSIDEAKHCVKILRKQKDDYIYITEGKGIIYNCMITNDNYNSFEAEIINKIDNPFSKNYYLHIAISPLKNPDRFEWFVEKATEIGIDEITPIICERTEKNKINIERINRISISAVKQSLQTTLPIINKAIYFNDFITIQSNNNLSKYIAWCETDKEVLLKNAITKSENSLILIGPEGDFTKEEINNAKKNNFVPISLGQARFRTETAAFVACNTIFIINQ